MDDHYLIHIAGYVATYTDDWLTISSIATIWRFQTDELLTPPHGVTTYQLIHMA